MKLSRSIIGCILATLAFASIPVREARAFSAELSPDLDPQEYAPYFDDLSNSELSYRLGVISAKQTGYRPGDRRQRRKSHCVCFRSRGRYYMLHTSRAYTGSREGYDTLSECIEERKHTGTCHGV